LGRIIPTFRAIKAVGYWPKRTRFMQKVSQYPAALVRPPVTSDAGDVRCR
jgi:hypothetical protein